MFYQIKKKKKDCCSKFCIYVKY